MNGSNQVAEAVNGSTAQENRGKSKNIHDVTGNTLIFDCVYGLFRSNDLKEEPLVTVSEKSEAPCSDLVEDQGGHFESSSNMIRIRAARSAHAQVELSQPVPVVSDLESCGGKVGYTAISVTSEESAKKCFKVTRVTLGLDGMENRCDLFEDDLVIEDVREFEALRSKLVKR